ncbi:MAG TPA: tRNA uridine-5-carboxymethylaminomethyl(34) synthesis GTPase MnmE [Deltaproteobacteria bacterium]|nr:tRNA uridine-5-carboxymethylaminomethyl(34) synthesis GTPase MnmE [Deltaproteobacteria bacterium]
MVRNDTIAAAATPWGEGGVAVVRLSGPEAVAAARRVFSGGLPGRARPRRLYYGSFIDPEGGGPIDDGFVVFMYGPASYTGEDTAELHCHGSPLVVGRLLDVLCRAGVRLAEPGEFTRRAFLNGKLDLAQAEAVADLIGAATDRALDAARRRLSGALSRRVAAIKTPLLELTARVEAELDFPEEEDVESVCEAGVRRAVEEAEAGLRALLATYRGGRVLRSGLETAIIGRPNVGKSSLLNLLLSEERAIVTPLPGTTRDVIEEVVNIRGVPVRLADTAGLREAAGRAEEIGVERARKRAAAADLVLFVVDASAADHDEDTALLDALGAARVVVVANKRDLVDEGAEEALRERFAGRRVVFVSALEGTGLGGLESAVFEEAMGAGGQIGAGLSDGVEGAQIATLRHKKAVERAIEGLERAGAAPDRACLASELRSALNALGEITGETTTEEILDEIFGRFCLGK